MRKLGSACRGEVVVDVVSLLRANTFEKRLFLGLFCGVPSLLPPSTGMLDVDAESEEAACGSPRCDERRPAVRNDNLSPSSVLGGWRRPGMGVPDGLDVNSSGGLLGDAADRTGVPLSSGGEPLPPPGLITLPVGDVWDGYAAPETPPSPALRCLSALGNS